MTMALELSRRRFLVHSGRGTIAFAVLGLAACAPAATSGPSAGASASAAASGGASPSGDPGSPSPAVSASAATSPSPATSAGSGGSRWERINLGFVSAYVLVRSGEAAVVDTGVSGSEDDIEAVLSAAGVGWGDVGHVILTHLHPDHAGSTAAVLGAASGATGYAGAEDIPGISAPRALTAVADGDDVFGLRIVATPGHTAGHIAVLDEAGGVLVAGDALGTSGGAPTPPGAQFTADMDEAMASIVRLGMLSFETLYVGHGDPITSGAAAQVAALGGS
jgi:glyoxylase-like metal-dependent hydrolase (beta-lactamase superfamily II)